MTHPLKRAFEARRGRGGALVIYVMAGDPSLEQTIALVPELALAGADVVELGLPFSDPMADGPTIQAAALRALSAKTTLPRVLEAVRDIRTRTDVPLVLMGYVNPVFSYGIERFAKDAGTAGVSGVILADLPAEDAEELIGMFRANEVAYVPLVAPTTIPERINRLGSLADGFVYYVSVAGVTGARAALPDDLVAKVSVARDAVQPAPLAVGFGVSGPEQARNVASFSDGVVVGSAFVRTLNEQGPEAAVAFVRRLREAMDARA